MPFPKYDQHKNNDSVSKNYSNTAVSRSSFDGSPIIKGRIFNSSSSSRSSCSDKSYYSGLDGNRSCDNGRDSRSNGRGDSRSSLDLITLAAGAVTAGSLLLLTKLEAQEVGQDDENEEGNNRNEFTHGENTNHRHSASPGGNCTSSASPSSNCDQECPPIEAVILENPSSDTNTHSNNNHNKILKISNCSNVRINNDYRSKGKPQADPFTLSLSPTAAANLQILPNHVTASAASTCTHTSNRNTIAISETGDSNNEPDGADQLSSDTENDDDLDALADLHGDGDENGTDDENAVSSADDEEEEGEKNGNGKNGNGKKKKERVGFRDRKAGFFRNISKLARFGVSFS